jgi:hypothetical protein
MRFFQDFLQAVRLKARGIEGTGKTSVDQLDAAIAPHNGERQRELHEHVMRVRFNKP